MQDIKKELEAIIFLSDKKIPLIELIEFFGIELVELKQILEEIKEDYKNKGLNLSIKNNEVRYITNPTCGEAISKFFNPTTKIKKLSKSSMETLTIIAIKGPITKTEIEDIKGTSVDGSIQVLLEKRLIHSKERKKALGSPKLYEVTDNFYGYVGVETKEELFSMKNANWLKGFEGEKDEN